MPWSRGNIEEPKAESQLCQLFANLYGLNLTPQKLSFFIGTTGYDGN